MANGMVLTREEVAEGWQVSQHGTISSPGKYEGQPAYVPAFWDVASEADRGEELPGGGYWVEFKLSPVDTSDWPELAGRATLRLAELEDGSVYEVDWAPEPMEAEA
jgi:hypothetical protein